MNTLKGIFPEPRQAPKRNFLRENMANIKQMQGLIQSTRAAYPRELLEKPIVYRRKSRSVSSTRQQMKGNTRIITAEKPKMITVEKNQSHDIMNKKFENICCRTAVESLKLALKENKHKGRDIGVQTEITARRLADNTTIGISPKINDTQPNSSYDRQNCPKPGEGDKTEPLADKKKDFVKENAQVVKSSPHRNEKVNNPINAPPNYKKGVVPKYIRERKDELFKQAKSMEGDEKCPEGHVMLPENERKETLRMLRQSYTELITELNLMPVKSDTLKIRNRKIELENQLKKLDEGIKVFTRPKVFVKIGA